MKPASLRENAGPELAGYSAPAGSGGGLRSPRFLAARGVVGKETDCGKNIATQKRAFDTDSQSSIFVSTNYGFFLAVAFL